MWISKKNLENIKQEAFKAGQKDLETKNSCLWESYNNAEAARAEIQGKHDELIKKLRTQSENDMIVEAVKVIFKGINGEEKATLNQHYQQMIAAQQGMGLYSSMSHWGVASYYRGIGLVGNTKPSLEQP